MDADEPGSPGGGGGHGKFIGILSFVPAGVKMPDIAGTREMTGMMAGIAFLAYLVEMRGLVLAAASLKKTLSMTNMFSKNVIYIFSRKSYKRKFLS